MKLDGGVDRFDLFGIHGWAADRDQPDATIGVDLLNNGERIATVAAAVPRPDLAAAGIGSGRHAFWLDPFEWLEYGENRLELRFAGTETALPEGGRTIYLDGLLVHRFHAGGPVARPAGYRREAVTGEAFLDALTRRLGAGPLEGRNVLEVAPGDGRLLAAMLARGIRYRSYVGLETSAGRAFQLVRRFGDRKTRFVHGSLRPGAAGPAPDLVLGLAAVEHLFPSFALAVLGIRSRLAAGAPLCLGLPRVDDEMLVSAAWVEDVAAGGDFVRVYSRVELERLLGRCGLDVDAVDALGPPGDGSAIFVCAHNTSRPAAAQAASALGPVVVSGTAETPAWLSRVAHAPRLQPSLRRLERWGAIGAVKRAVSAVRRGRP